MKNIIRTMTTIILLSMLFMILQIIDQKRNPEKYVDKRVQFCEELWWKIISEYGWLFDGSRYRYCILANKENMEIKKIPLNDILYLK